MEKEEGEMSDDSNMVIDVDQPVIKKESPSASEATVLYTASKQGIFINQLEKVDASKLEERAKRFGLNLGGSKLITQKQIDELYSKAGIVSGNERHFRIDTLHLSAINGLTTKEIFEYLEDYRPVSMEKIDDISCNIVCQDHISAALALLVHSREIRDQKIVKMIADKSHHHWREGMPHPKKDFILMRFATNSDKKFSTNKKHGIESCENNDDNMEPATKNPWGDLCRSWGVYDHQEIFIGKMPKNDYEEDIDEDPKIITVKNKKLAKRLGKRKQMVEVSEEDSSSDSEWNRKIKAPRMRMHADDEESKQKKKKKLHQDIDDYREEEDSFAPLSIEVINSQTSYSPRETTKLSDKFKVHRNRIKDSIQSRLGVKIAPIEQVEHSNDYDDDDGEYDESDHCVMSRVQKVNNKRVTSSVWSRLENKTSKESSQNDLRRIIKSKKHSTKKNPDDLRERLGKLKKSNLRIEIDNNYAD